MPIPGQEPGKNTDAAAQAAIAAAKEEADGKNPKDQPGEGKDAPGGINYSDPKQTEEVIKSLRSESAKYRTTNKELNSKVEALGGTLSKLETGLKGLFGDSEKELTVDERIKQLETSQATKQEEIQANESKTALLELAYEHEVPKKDMSYFKFLISEELEGLKESEELSEERITELATQAKAVGAPKNTSVGAGKGGSGTGKAPSGKADESGDVTIDQFIAMSLTEKSKLYTENKDLYTTLIAAAKKANKLV